MDSRDSTQERLSSLSRRERTRPSHLEGQRRVAGHRFLVALFFSGCFMAGVRLFSHSLVLGPRSCCSLLLPSLSLSLSLSLISPGLVPLSKVACEPAIGLCVSRQCPSLRFRVLVCHYGDHPSVSAVVCVSCASGLGSLRRVCSAFSRRISSLLRPFHPRQS